VSLTEVKRVQSVEHAYLYEKGRADIGGPAQKIKHAKTKNG